MICGKLCLALFRCVGFLKNDDFTGIGIFLIEKIILKSIFLKQAVSKYFYGYGFIF